VRAPVDPSFRNGQIFCLPLDRLDGGSESRSDLRNRCSIGSHGDEFALDVADVEETETGLLVTIRGSKTDQAGAAETARGRPATFDC
jgi:hypothetical protein